MWQAIYWWTTCIIPYSGQERETEGVLQVCTPEVISNYPMALPFWPTRCEKCGGQCRRMFDSPTLSKKFLRLLLAGSPCTVMGLVVLVALLVFIFPHCHSMIKYFPRTILYGEMVFVCRGQLFLSWWSSLNQSCSHCRTSWFMRTLSNFHLTSSFLYWKVFASIVCYSYTWLNSQDHFISPAFRMKATMMFPAPWSVQVSIAES